MRLECRSGARAELHRSPSGAQDPERTTGLRKDARGLETTLFRDRRISRHSWETHLPVESKTRTHYGPVGSTRRTAGRQGGAGLGRTGRRWVDPARRQPSLLPSSESRTLS